MPKFQLSHMDSVYNLENIIFLGVFVDPFLKISAKLHPVFISNPSNLF